MRTWLTLAFVVTGCTVKNQDHCYYHGGDAACPQDPVRTYCSQCTNQNDGCVEDVPEDACYVATAADTGGTTVPSSSEASTTISATESTLGTTSTTTTTTTGSESSTASTQPPETSSESGEPSPCGNGMLDKNEDCDGDELDGASCMSLGYDGGMLACSAECLYELGMCDAPDTCDNGQLDMDEQCDDNLFAVPTCAEFSNVYGGGVLGCNVNCTYNTDACCVAGGQLCNMSTNCCHGDCALVCPLGAPP